MKRFQKHITTLAFLLPYAAIPGTAFAAGLSLDSYLSQVDGQARDVKAAKEAAEGAGLRVSESTLLYSPMLFGDAQWADDHKTNSLFPAAYSEYRYNYYNLGISQQTNFGLTGRVSYYLAKYQYLNGPNNGQPFWEGTPKIELTFSLLQNFLGSQTRAQYELIEASALSTQFTQSYQAKAIRATAESTYVQLANARQLREIEESSLKKAQDILDWANRRFKLNLAENSDVYQAQANVESFKLELQSAMDLERTTSREFNRLRAVDGDEVGEELSLPDLTAARVPSRAQYRDDVRAAIEGTRVASANAQIGAEKNKPTLEVYGSYAMNARTLSGSDAISRSLSDEMGPTKAIGVRFQAPLLIGAETHARNGYEKERAAAETLKDQKVFDQEVEWKQLTLRLDEAKKRYEIAQSLVEIQKKKFDTERDRLKKGRSTTYQTLLFEQDLNQAEAAKIRAQGDILQIIAQMKTYQ